MDYDNDPEMPDWKDREILGLRAELKTLASAVEIASNTCETLRERCARLERERDEWQGHAERMRSVYASVATQLEDAEARCASLEAALRERLDDEKAWHDTTWREWLSALALLGPSPEGAALSEKAGFTPDPAPPPEPDDELP